MKKSDRKEITRKEREQRFTKSKILKAIEGSGGIISNIASNLCCDWHTANKYANMYNETILALESESETLIDNAENAMHNLISSGDGMMIRYYLSTKGKKRGYVEKQVHEIEAGGFLSFLMQTNKVTNDTGAGN